MEVENIGFILIFVVFLSIQAVVDGLKAKGHNVTEVDVGKSIVQGITRVGETLYANSDYRKGGTTAGY